MNKIMGMMKDDKGLFQGGKDGRVFGKKKKSKREFLGFLFY